MMEFGLFNDEDPEDEPKKRSTMIQSISIAMRFLQAMAASDRPLPLAELSRLSGVGRSTAHRYLQTLVKEDLARQDPQTSRYDLGPAALGLGMAALKRVDGVEICGQQMKILAETMALSGGVAIWTDRGPTLVRWYRSAHFSITPVGLGDILPVDNTACGLVFQAWLSRAKAEVARRNQPAHFRGTPPAAEKLAEVRRDAWCDLSSHLLSNVMGQAAPVLDAQGELICVLTTVTDLGQVGAPEQRQALRDVAHRVNLATGGTALLGG